MSRQPPAMPSISRTIPRTERRQRAGFLEVDLVVAIALLMVAALPLAYSFTSDQRVQRAAYERAAAMELLDGQMELLAAGGWRNYPQGTNEIALTGASAVNLTPNRALLIIGPHSLRLEWHPAKRVSSGISREVRLP
jgi:hypothetical protein